MFKEKPSNQKRKKKKKKPIEIQSATKNDMWKYKTNLGKTSTDSGTYSLQDGDNNNDDGIMR